MEAKLTEQELDRIGLTVAKEYYRMSRHEGVYAEIDKISNAYAKQILEHYNPEINSFIETRDFFKPILEKAIKDVNFIKEVAKPLITEALNSEDFKKVSIQMLKDKISQLENEIEENKYNPED
jgi:hypothetical protein